MSPSADHPLSQMYARRALDSIVDTAHAVSLDFVRRPHLYAGVPYDLAGLMDDFRTRTGVDPAWPDASARALVSSPALFRTCLGSVGLRREAMALTQGAGRADRTARRAFLEEAAVLRSSLDVMAGQALAAADAQTRDVFDRAVTVVTSREVASAFGLRPAPTEEAPDSGPYSAEVAYLCEAVSRTLLRDRIAPLVSQYRLTLAQRAARHGALTIAGVMDASLEDRGGDAIDEVVDSAYLWARALTGLLDGIDVIRAWKEPDYRMRLQVIERDMLPPHPAGDLELHREEFLRADGGPQTVTVLFEMCCCSGDFCAE